MTPDHNAHQKPHWLNTGNPQQDIFRRQVAAALLRPTNPTNVGEGINAVARALMYRAHRKAWEREDSGATATGLTGAETPQASGLVGVAKALSVPEQEGLNVEARSVGDMQGKGTGDPGAKSAKGQNSFVSGGRGVVMEPRAPDADDAFNSEFESLPNDEKNRVLEAIEGGMSPTEAIRPDGYSPQNMIGPQSRLMDAQQMKLADGSSFPATERSFGVGGAIRGTANRAFDAFGAEPPFPQVQTTQGNFSVLGERLLNSITESYGRQPPSWLLRQIKDLTPKVGSPLEGPSQAREKLRALDADLVTELERLQATEPTQLTNSGIQDIRAQIEGVKSARERIGEALQSFEGAEFQTTEGGVKWRMLD